MVLSASSSAPISQYVALSIYLSPVERSSITKDMSSQNRNYTKLVSPLANIPTNVCQQDHGRMYDKLL
jgi:hypothetical protein